MKAPEGIGRIWYEESVAVAMTKCDRCQTGDPEPTSCVLNFWGGKQKRYLLCKFCIALIELTLEGSGGKNCRA